MCNTIIKYDVCCHLVRVGLAGSGYSYKGRLEVKHNGYFSTVCTDGFDDTDASVFCYELGFG